MTMSLSPVSPHDRLRHVTRRHFFENCGVGLGAMALGSLLGPSRGEAAVAANLMAARPPHHAPRAKAVIFLFMAGGPSQLDLFSEKPALRKHHGQLPPE